MPKSLKRQSRTRKIHGGTNGDTCKFCARIQCQLDKNTQFCNKCSMNKELYCDKTGIKSSLRDQLPVPRMNTNLASMDGVDAALGIFEAIVRDAISFNTYENRFSLKGFIADIDNPANQYTQLKKDFLHVYADDAQRRLFNIIDLVLNQQKVLVVNTGEKQSIVTPLDIRTAINNLSGTIGYYDQIRMTYKDYTDSKLIKQILEILKPEVIKVDPSFRNPEVWRFANPFDNFDLLLNFTKLDLVSQELMYIYYKYHKTALQQTKPSLLNRLRNYVAKKKKTILVPRNVSEMASVGYIDPISMARLKQAMSRNQRGPLPPPPIPQRPRKKTPILDILETPKKSWSNNNRSNKSTRSKILREQEALLGL
jgi:hypothetical protein